MAQLQPAVAFSRHVTGSASTVAQPSKVASLARIRASSVLRLTTARSMGRGRSSIRWEVRPCAPVRLRRGSPGRLSLASGTFGRPGPTPVRWSECLRRLGGDLLRRALELDRARRRAQEEDAKVLHADVGSGNGGEVVGELAVPVAELRGVRDQRGARAA